MSISNRASGWVTSLVAGLVASRLVKLGWRLVTKSKPPTDKQDLSLSTAQVVSFAALVAAATAVAQTLAERRALARQSAIETDAGQVLEG
ncbi:MAG: DUF4235 domain-containing protein [Micrococcales bacterium]|nr:DUF4235 domain-containing protein [Micrococcales bacterium]